MTHSSSLKEKGGHQKYPPKVASDVIKADLLTVQMEKLSHREGGDLPEVMQHIWLS